jgi:hypothetical protein
MTGADTNGIRDFGPEQHCLTKGRTGSGRKFAAWRGQKPPTARLDDQEVLVMKLKGKGK